MRFSLLIIAIALAWPWFAAAESVVRETMLQIPTYALGREDANPPLFNASVYPYPMQTAITGSKAIQRHRAVILENDYIRVIILPDLGGRIYAAEDKTNGDFDFIYHNHVIKPGLVALRGAWLSGGIEWNFPTRGHTVNTVSPVKYKTFRDEQTGAVGCVVGTTEWVRRMRWSVTITLPGNESRFIYRVRLENPTLTHNLAYFWANAAVHAWEDTRVTFPPAAYTFAGRRADPKPWPIVNGKDMSWYKNTPNPYDYFCGTSGDYQGAYNYDRDNGTVHCANRFESMGRKFWTWGTAPGGMIWEKILTDADGQYIEVQSGRLLTQGDAWVFEPHMAESWEETWYPIKGMKGFVKACPSAAVNVAVADGKALLAVNATRAIAGATMQLLADGKTVFEEKADLVPAGVWKKEVTVEKAAQYRFAVRDGGGHEIISHEPNRKEEIPPPQLEPSFPPDDKCTAEQLYLKGYYAAKSWNPEAAVAHYQAALKADPGLTGALVAMAMHCHKTGRYQEALAYAEKALLRNDDDVNARYYRALAKMKLGIESRTEEDLEMIGRRAGYRHIAPYLRAALAVKRGDLSAAAELLSQIRDDSRAAVMLAAIGRRMGQADRAKTIIDQALAQDRLNPLAVVERALQGATDGLDVLRDDAQEYLEAACAYEQMNLRDDAAAVLKTCVQRDSVQKDAFVFLHLGYLSDRTGQRTAAQEYYERGIAQPADYVFPSRSEDFAVLETALRYAPNEWKLHYYLGLLLTANMRWEEGLKQFEMAQKSSPEFAPLYWCLAEIYRNKTGDVAKAQPPYERALALNPNDCAYYIALDQVYASRRLNDLRAKLYSAVPTALQNDYRLLLHQAMWLTDVGRFDEALAILRQTHFHPWEGWSGAHDVYVRALRGRAQKSMQATRWMEAIEDLKAAMEYPENLGSGRPAHPDPAYENYHVGVCYRSMGDLKQAREYFQKVSSGKSEWQSTAAEQIKSLGAE